MLMILGWLGTTAVTTAVAYVAVDAAGSRVTDRPLAVVMASTSTTTSTSDTSTVTSTSTLDVVTTTSTTTATTSTTSPTNSPTTTTAPTNSPTTTAAPATTTTSSEALWQLQTINSAAGKVIVSYRPAEVRLESVAPLVGFTYEIEDDGPSEVRVEFDGPLRVEIRAVWRDGELFTEVHEDD